MCRQDVDSRAVDAGSLGILPLGLIAIHRNNAADVARTYSALLTHRNCDAVNNGSFTA